MNDSHGGGRAQAKRDSSALGVGVRLGRIAGIDIRLDWSLLIIFFLITFSLAGGVFPAWHPDWSGGLAWVTALGAAILFFASVLIHELSHAVVGRANGVDIRRITLFMFGGVAHLESEPGTWRAEFAMAIVGPITSLILGFIFLWLAGLAAGSIEVDMDNPTAVLAQLGPLSTLLFWLGPVNILLALFNLVPGFPLDGGRVLRAIMWGLTGDLLRATRWASRMGQAFAWLLMALGFAMILGLRVPVFGTGLLNGMWIAFIGWFLNNAALMSYRQLLVRETLEDVPVERLMQTNFSRVDPNVTVSDLIDRHLMSSGQRAFPVEQDGRFLGLVCVRDLRKHERSAWDTTPVSAIMTVASELTTISPHQDAAETLSILAASGVNQLPVLDQGTLVGLLRREDVLTWLSVHGMREDGAKRRREAHA